MTDRDKLKDVIDYLNKNYSQDSRNYSIFNGAKPGVFMCGEHTAVSLWACGAIVCIGSILYFISEDDGNWFFHDDEAVQECFSIGWGDSFMSAMDHLIEFVKENGHPEYYTGTREICNYSL